jgi:hypothetical protein
MEEEIEILRLTSRADSTTMNNIGASATSHATASHSAAYSYLGHRWMTTFRSAEDVKASLAMIRGYNGARSEGPTSRPPSTIISTSRNTAMGRSPSKQFLDGYYSVDYRQDMLRLWVSGADAVNLHSRADSCSG